MTKSVNESLRLRFAEEEASPGAAPYFLDMQPGLQVRLRWTFERLFPLQPCCQTTKPTTRHVLTAEGWMGRSMGTKSAPTCRFRSLVIVQCGNVFCCFKTQTSHGFHLLQGIEQYLTSWRCLSCGQRKWIITRPRPSARGRDPTSGSQRKRNTTPWGLPRLVPWLRVCFAVFACWHKCHCYTLQSTQ